MFSIVYYYVWGKKQYLGPLIDTEVRALMRKNVEKGNTGRVDGTCGAEKARGGVTGWR